MSLSVLSIAFPYAPVGPRAVGGAEKILGELDEALTRAGNTSMVVACEGSQTCGELFDFSLDGADARNADLQAPAPLAVQDAIDRALRSQHVDLVHMHGLDFNRYRVPAELTVVVTLHLPIAWYPAQAWTFRQPVQFCCVSQSQWRTRPRDLDGAMVIENGVALPALDFEVQRENFALALGRICPEKNAHEALDAGTRAGVPVLLGGQVFPYPAHRRYFDEEIAPRLETERNGVWHRFLGPLEHEEAQRLLQRARCLLHPTLAPETSSLVAMEALAAGTPVIAYPSGALPEIVEEGVTGFLVRGVDAMAEALGKVQRLSRAACRRSAEERFDKRRMVERYFGVYHELTRTVPWETTYA